MYALYFCTIVLYCIVIESWLVHYFKTNWANMKALGDSQTGATTES